MTTYSELCQYFRSVEEDGFEWIASTLAVRINGNDVLHMTYSPAEIVPAEEDKAHIPIETVDFCDVSDGKVTVSLLDGSEVVLGAGKGTFTLGANGAEDRVETVAQARAQTDQAVFSMRPGVDVGTYRFDVAIPSATGGVSVIADAMEHFLRDSNIVVFNRKPYWWRDSKCVYEDIEDKFYGLINTMFEQMKSAGMLTKVASRKQVTEIIDSYLDDYRHGRQNMLERDRPYSEDDLIPFRNGLFCVKDGTLITDVREREKYFFTALINADYVDGGAEDADMERQIEYMFPNKDQRDLLWEYLGYSLYCPDNRAKAFLVLSGGADCGKSWICNLAQRILGETMCTSITYHQLGARFGLDKLQFSRMNIVEEVDQSGRSEFDSGAFKNMVSGGSVVADVKNKKPIEFRCCTKFLFATNNFINFGADTGVFKRYHLLSLENPISTADGIRIYHWLDDPDKLTWTAMQALDGWGRLMAKDYIFTEPRDEIIILEDYQAECDTFGQWSSAVIDSLGIGPLDARDAMFETWCYNQTDREVYDQYRTWMDVYNKGVKVLQKPQFTGKMKDRFRLKPTLTHKDGRQVRCYRRMKEQDA